MNIYMTGEWAGDFLDGTMIALKKKQKAQKCVDYRTISITSYTANIVGRILNRRLEQPVLNWMEEVMEENWIGFRKGKQTVDAIEFIQIISERVVDINGEVY